MDEKAQTRDFHEPFQVPWTAGVRELRPGVRPAPNAPLLMRLNRNPFALQLPWTKRERYWEPRESQSERVRFSAGRQEAQDMRNWPSFTTPAEDRDVLVAPPTLRARRCP
jgi:hypothetical protein